MTYKLMHKHVGNRERYKEAKKVKWVVQSKQGEHINIA